MSLQSYKPHYLANWVEALRQFVKISRWDLVQEMLTALTDSRERLDPVTLLDAIWWVLRSDAVAKSPEWMLPLESLDLSTVKSNGLSTPEYRHEVFSAIVNVARSLGWIHPGLHPGDIAEKIYRAWSLVERLTEQDESPTILVFQAAALGCSPTSLADPQISPDFFSTSPARTGAG